MRLEKGGTANCWLLCCCVLLFPFVGEKRDEWRDKWMMGGWWWGGGNSLVWMELDGELGGRDGGAPDVEGTVRPKTAGSLSSQ